MAPQQYARLLLWIILPVLLVIAVIGKAWPGRRNRYRRK
jgi:hypothetical protein